MWLCIRVTNQIQVETNLKSFFLTFLYQSPFCFKDTANQLDECMCKNASAISYILVLNLGLAVPRHDCLSHLHSVGWCRSICMLHIIVASILRLKWHRLCFCQRAANAMSAQWKSLVFKACRITKATTKCFSLFFGRFTWIRSKRSKCYLTFSHRYIS